MKLIFILPLTFLVCSAVPRSNRKFPNDFLFGTATASYQIEGAWDEDGKSENIWDRLTHTRPELILDHSSGDVADDSYHQYKRDVEMMRELGTQAYRFSISWVRILPNGFSNYINQAGIDFYNNYIDEMLKYNITPFITLFHWDLPQKLQDLGGLANPLFVDWFEDYAKVIYQNFGDRVKYFITFNEPLGICNAGYADVTLAPILNITDVAEYICAKNLVLAHARAYHLYDKEFRATQGGEIGYTNYVAFYEPLEDTEDDKFAAELARQIEMIPNSMYHVIKRVSERYNNPKIYITENGWSTLGGLQDDDRVKYYRAAWEDVLDAVEAGYDVRGYMAWSLMDNFEWMGRYVQRFGLYEVDYEDPNRTRTPRKSAFVYKHLIKNRFIDYTYEPEEQVMTIDQGH